MKAPASRIKLPRYHGQKWIAARLPQESQLWLLGKYKSVRKERSNRGELAAELHKAIEGMPWRWPKRTVYFFADLHADTDAFLASLVASGGFSKTGPRDKDFRLTGAGRKARFLIGGDCFDKGPSSLRLLRMIRLLMAAGADVELLAGNHDIRMLVGIRSLDLEQDPRTEHFFVRMGPKAVPFFKEISDEYLRGKNALHGIPDNRACRRKLFPRKRWFSEFPRLARWDMHEQQLQREMERMQKKYDTFENSCTRAGLSLRMVYAAARKWQALFLHPGGEFHWFYRRMKAVHRERSFLFIHAGLDDRSAALICDKGIGHLNRLFHEQLQQDLFDFYYGPVANIVRTKYRDADRPLTRRGTRLLHRKGIHAIVHGHVNRNYGQRIMLRKGLLNFECDAMVDRNTRRRQGLKGQGAAVTVFHPERVVMGISTDYPYIKIFQPEALLR